jgi:hypothetical protein
VKWVFPAIGDIQKLLNHLLSLKRIMKNLLLCMLFLMPAIGCSRLVNFVIINYTDEPISVIYFLKPYDMQPAYGEPCCPKGYTLSPPTIVPIEKLDKNLLSIFPECDYVFDKTTGKVTTTIPPNKAIWVQSISGGYSGGKHEYYYSNSSFEIRKIIIKTSKGLKEFDEVEAMKVFKRYHFFDSELFAIEIK